MLTQRKKVHYLFIGLIFISILFSTTSLFAAPFYEGKKISIICGYAPGGGYDRIARIMAKYLPKYIPGKPAIIVENMEGGGTMIAANHIYNVSKPDGFTIGIFDRGIPFAQLAKLDGVKFDIMKYAWIGSAASEATVMAIRNDLPFKTIQDMMKTTEPVYLCNSGAGTMEGQFGIFVREFLKVNIKFIIYPSNAEGMLAVERKEAMGRSGSYSSLKPYIERGLVHPVIRGRVSEPGIESLPVNEDLTNDSVAKSLMAMLSAPDRVGRPFVAPPKTPQEPMEILRKAFAEAAKDPELQAEGTKVGLNIQYFPVDVCMKELNFLFSQPENIVKEFAKTMRM